MKTITALLFLLLLVATVDVCCQQLSETEDQGRKKSSFLSNSNIGEDMTEIQVKNIFDLFQFFHKQTIEKSHADWIGKHRTFGTPSQIINSANITFTKFISDEEILPILLLKAVECEFRRSLTVQFDQAISITIIEGNATFFHLGNISSCQVSFNFDLKRVIVEFTMKKLDKMAKESAGIVFQDFTQHEMKNFKIMKSERESCLPDTHQEQILNYASQAMKNIIKERFEIIARLVFESMMNNCLHSQLNKKSENYSLFKLEPNPDEFPWNSDYNILNITGLNHIARLSAEYSNTTITSFYTHLYNVNIRRDVVSVTTRKLNSTFNMIDISARTAMPTDYKEIDLERIAEKSSYNHIILDQDQKFEGIAYTDQLGVKNLIDVLQIYIPGMCNQFVKCNASADVYERNLLALFMMAGIEQTFQKIRYDGTREFTNTFRNILAPFDGKIFENLLNNSEKRSYKDFSASFINIEMEAYQNLKNITCTPSNGNQKIGIIGYKNITARANFIFIGDRKTFDGYKKHVLQSARVYIKQVNFDISLQRYPNWTDEIKFQIDDDLEKADITITLEDILRRENRVTLGNLIFQVFIKFLRDRVTNTMNSAFYPFFTACTRNDSSSNTVQPNANYFADSRQYFAFIRGHWVHSTRLSSIQSVDVLINGTWNFKDINARYANGNLIFDGLRMENIAGSIKLWKKSDDPVVLDYVASYLSLIIDHKNTTVGVKVPKGLNFPNASHVNLNMPEVTEIFEIAVASFIERSIYGNSMLYHMKYRTLLIEAMKVAEQKDISLMYDATSVFVDNIVKTIKNIPSEGIYHQPDEFPLKFEIANSSTDLSIFPSRIFIDFDVAIKALEICDDFNYSQNANSFFERFTLFGDITIREEIDSGNELSRIYFEVEDHRVANISNNKNEYSKQLQIYIPKENITINERFGSHDEDILKEKLTQIARKFVEMRLNERFPSPPNLCRHRFGNLVPSENHFFLITKTINLASQHLLIYHIKLYGLYNLKFLGYFFNDGPDGLEGFTLHGDYLTAHVIWSSYIGNSSPKIPREMKLQIDRMFIGGLINNRLKILYFTKDSTLQFSDQDVWIPSRFQDILTVEITDSIKNLVKEEYERN